MIRLTCSVPDPRCFSLLFRRNLALLPRFLDNANEYIFKRELLLANTFDLYPILGKLAFRIPFTALGIFIVNVLKACAEKRNSPTLRLIFEHIGRALRLVDNEFQEMAFLFSFDRGGASFGYDFTRRHESQAIALLRLFQVVRGYQDCGTGVGELIDPAPEGAPRQGIDARGWLVEK